MVPFSTKYLDRQLSAAIHFSSLKPTTTPVASTHTGVGAAVNRMIECIEFEANESYSTQLKSVNTPILHVVSLASNKPGIISEFNDNTCTIYRPHSSSHSDPHSDPRSGLMYSSPPIGNTTYTKEQQLNRAKKQQQKTLAKQEKIISQKLEKSTKPSKDPLPKKTPPTPTARVALKRQLKSINSDLKQTADPQETSTLMAQREICNAALDVETEKINKKKEQQQFRKAQLKQASRILDPDVEPTIAATDPPIANPPIANPPIANPPIANPPIANPPIANPPIANPPVEPIMAAPDPTVANPTDEPVGPHEEEPTIQSMKKQHQLQ